MERTLCIIKPDAVENKYQGKILQLILDAGFKILGLKMIKLNRTQAQEFYYIHRERAFYSGLVDFMVSGHCIVIALEKENAIEDFRGLIGATDPAEANEGTIRKLFAENKQRNAVHGSDSIENGFREINFFFSESELY